MDEDDGVATVEFSEDRIEGRIPDILFAVAGKEPDAFCFQCVVGVGDFGQRCLDVRHRHHGKYAEAARVVAAQPRHVVVAGPGDTARIRRIVEAVTRYRDRGVGRRETALVHQLECARDAPAFEDAFLVWGTALGEPEVRCDVMVDVDEFAARLGGNLARNAGRSQKGPGAQRR